MHFALSRITFPRPSFRQLLVVAFLLVAALLASVALRTLLTLERLLVQTREGAAREVQLNADARMLAERGLAMERAARQYLVLRDRALVERFDAAAHEGSDLLDRLAADAPISAQAAAWRARRDAIGALLAPRSGRPRVREDALVAAFSRLDGTVETIAEQVRAAARERNQALLEELDRNRAAIANQVVGAILAALVLALVFGFWLSRPLVRVEDAIVRLGENRLDDTIRIRGPSDVHRLARRLDWLRLRLAELDSDKARFLRRVSHELKTPLAALREGVALLEEGVAGALSEKQQRVARILRENTALLQSHIEDLLRYNAAAFDARRLVRKPTELGALVAGVAQGQQLQARSRGVSVNVTGAPVWADVDADKLGVAVGNLLSNAIRCSPVGGEVEIALHAAREGKVAIEVADRGLGVAPADRARIFEPFYLGERQPADLPRGSGIGLSIVNELVTAHGGSVVLLPDSPGARFRIELPHAALA
jgi:two-component system sensor histidine kinase GlrK